MLTRLSIQNYAIIESLELDLSAKLNVITGETGAGKSILVGALGLILGDRADTGVLVDKNKKCIVEGFFTGQLPEGVQSFLAEHDLDHNDELVMRREIGTNGKSRAFINDTPVNVSQLEELSALLVDLHQQFDTLSINESDFQREVLDALANQFNAVTAYQQTYREWQKTHLHLSELEQQQAAAAREADFNNFQYKELEEASFGENELEEAEATIKMMSHAQGIRSVLEKANQALTESETPIVQQLKSLVNQLQPLSSYHPDLDALVSRMQSAQVEIQDIAASLSSIGEDVEYDPEKIARLEERLSLGYRLQKKHGVNSTAGLIEIKHELEEKITASVNIEEEIEKVRARMLALHQTAEKQAAGISAARKKQVAGLEKKINALLNQVGMPNARLKAEIKPSSLKSHGMDDVEFLFNANTTSSKANATFLPVKKVASGGELSRLMLCIKSLVAKSMSLPTLIFDEIDTGISGEAARQVAMILKDLSSSMQVICVTHQPQIAGKADHHYFVYKEIVGDRIQTNIKLLKPDERILSIARMLGGEKPTAAAMENAKEMLN